MPNDSTDKRRFDAMLRRAAGLPAEEEKAKRPKKKMKAKKDGAGKD